jgi:hypothetical protein
MHSRPPGLPDWKDLNSYTPLMGADLAGFAWEWLRRCPAYRAAASISPRRQLEHSGITTLQADSHSAMWGLHAFEDPDLCCADARPVWKADHYPLVLPVSAEAAGASADAFLLGSTATIALLVIERRSEHLLLSDGRRSIRMDVCAGTIRTGPARLHYELAGFTNLDPKLMVLRRLAAYRKSGCLGPGLFRPETRAARLILLLRASDALRAGASQREIAAELLDADAQAARWRVDLPSTRSRVQRLARRARSMTANGHVELLRSAARSLSRC